MSESSLSTARAEIGAKHSNGLNIYRDDSTVELWMSTDEELKLLGSSILDDDDDAYSCWAADVPAVEVCLDNLVREWQLDNATDLDDAQAKALAGGHLGDYMALRHFREDVETVIGNHADAAAWDAAS